MDNILHYEETQLEKRVRLQSTGNFYHSAICGNGSAHARLTRCKKLVNCESCKQVLNKKRMI